MQTIDSLSSRHIELDTRTHSQLLGETEPPHPQQANIANHTAEDSRGTERDGCNPIAGPSTKIHESIVQKENQMEDAFSSSFHVRSRSERQRRSSSYCSLQLVPPSSHHALVVNGYTIRSHEKRVMYHIDVGGYQSQLQTYTILRSFTDFKHLHKELNTILQTRREEYWSVYDPPRLSSTSERTSMTSTRSRNSSTTQRIYDSDTRHDLLSTEENKPWFLSFVLPSLPSTGFLSYWKRLDRSHIHHRCEMFQQLLLVVTQQPELFQSIAMQQFLSIAPCAIRERGSSYVSLCEYSVPQLNLEEENRERKKIALERRRNSSSYSQTSTLVLEES